ncbi:hypothetical protein HJC23_001669 [Cyclotella cryptica]|uniref:Uncharacterized protein n=1 Tax=Cyclotella cryptica TaxID=29204 RepID=A0ABD3QK94_9STRA|eukprot:CCRYP_004702-RA/>CCRYP_004702-RA protein AED:0.00 eAED:0.00 QI:588/1/1/1/1/1/2/228/1321
MTYQLLSRQLMCAWGSRQRPQQHREQFFILRSIGSHFCSRIVGTKQFQCSKICITPATKASIMPRASGSSRMRPGVALLLASLMSALTSTSALCFRVHRSNPRDITAPLSTTALMYTYTPGCFCPRHIPSTLLKMSNVPSHSSQFFDEEQMNSGGYYGRGRSQLAKLAQQSQQRQSWSHISHNNDLQSTLNEELNLMENRLLQFQETSRTRSQALLENLEAFSNFGVSTDKAIASTSTDGPYLGSFTSSDADFDTNKGAWVRSSMQNVLPTAASIAGLSSLGLLRDRMMKRHPKEQEAWMERNSKHNQQLREIDERRKRSNRSALSTAAGLGAFAVTVGTTHLPPVRPDGDFETINRASTESSRTSAGSPQNILAEVRRASQIGLNGGVANAATTLDEYGDLSRAKVYSAEAVQSSGFILPNYETNPREESLTQPLTAVNDGYGAANRYPDQLYESNSVKSVSIIEETSMKRPSFTVWNKKLLDEEKREMLENNAATSFTATIASIEGNKMEPSTTTDLAKGPSFTVWKQQLLDQQLDDLPFGSSVASSSTFVASADRSNAQSASRIEMQTTSKPLDTKNGVMFGSSAAASSTSIIASEFSRGANGIYESQSYTKEAPSRVYSGGFSPPLKELKPRTSRNFMLGGVPFRDLKSMFDAREQTSESDPKRVNQAPRETAVPVKRLTSGNLRSSVAPAILSIPREGGNSDETLNPSRTQSSTDSISKPKISPATQSKASPELSIIPEKIPLTRDDLLPSEPSDIKSHIPERIQMRSDSDAPQALLPPQQNAEPKISVKSLNVRGTSFEITDEEKDVSLSTDYPNKVSSQNTFYQGIAAGTFAAAVAKAFRKDSESREISSSTAGETNGFPPPPSSVPQENIITDKPFVFKSFRAESQMKRESRFEIKTPSTSVSSKSVKMKAGEERISVGMDSTIEIGSSLGFTAGSDSSGAFSFREVTDDVPSYNEIYAINSKAVVDDKTSYLDSLSRALPTPPTSGMGIKSYLDELSNVPPLLLRTPSLEPHDDNVGNSINLCGSSLDNISQDLKIMSKYLDSITPDISSDLDSISSDLDSVTQDISTASAALFACSRQQEESKNYLSNVSHFESYLDSLSQETKTRLSSTDGFEKAPSLSFEEYDLQDSTTKPRSYLDSISKGDPTLLRGKGLTSYVSELSSAPPLAFDLTTQESLSPPVPPVLHSSISSYTKPASDFNAIDYRRPRRVRVFVEHSVDLNKSLGGLINDGIIDATPHPSYNEESNLYRDGSLSAMQWQQGSVIPAELSSNFSGRSASTSSYSSAYNVPSANGKKRRVTVTVDHFVESAYEH